MFLNGRKSDKLVCILLIFQVHNIGIKKKVKWIVNDIMGQVRKTNEIRMLQSS